MQNYKLLEEKIVNTKILVIGDIMLDHYLWGDVKRISPEAPVPIVEALKDKFVLGGAANVANNLRTLGVNVSIVSAIGCDDAAKKLTTLLKENGINSSYILEEENYLTTIKTRVLTNQQQLLRLDREEKCQLSLEKVQKILANLRKVWFNYDAIILSDYGKGFLSSQLLDGIREINLAAKKLIIVDPKAKNFLCYRDFSCITPNQLEAETAFLDNFESLEHLKTKAQEKRAALNLECLLITLGSRGMMVTQESASIIISAKAREVFDVTGAGDTVVSVLTVAKACGLSWEASARLANEAAGLVVLKLGAATISKEEFLWIQQSLKKDS